MVGQYSKHLPGTAGELRLDISELEVYRLGRRSQKEDESVSYFSQPRRDFSSVGTIGRPCNWTKVRDSRECSFSVMSLMLTVRGYLFKTKSSFIGLTPFPFFA